MSDFGGEMGTTELKRLVMAGPMRWIALTTNGKVTTLAWFVKVAYSAHGAGTVLFCRSDLHGRGQDDVFAVFSDNLRMAQHLRDAVFYYSAFAGSAPVVEASFHSQSAWPDQIEEKMVATASEGGTGGTTLTLSFWELGAPTAYVRQVDECLTEVGAYAIPGRFSVAINGVEPLGRAEVGPVAEAPPIGADLQNLWFER
jgi:hypothetical protein